MEKQPLVCILIINWNGYADTLECIKSLEKITYENFKVIVVDNNSTDPINRTLASSWPEKVISVNSSENLGFTGGNNLAFNVAEERFSPDYFLLLNNDTQVKEDFLSKLVAFAQANPKSGITCPLIYFESNPEKIWYAGGKIKKSLGIPYHTNPPPREKIDAAYATEFASGCCALIRRDTYLEIGGFDDRLFLYCEDADLSMRALSAGWKINIVPEACILHKIHGSMGEKALRINSYYVNRNRLFLIFKLYATKPMKLFLLTTYFIFSRSVKFMLLMLCGRIACGLLLFEGVVDALKANMFRRKRAF